MKKTTKNISKKMELSLSHVYTCKCNPNFNYKTKSSFSNHFRSKRHVTFQQNVDKIGDKLKIQQLEKEIKQLKSEVRIWKEKFLELDLSLTKNIDFLC